MEATAALTSVDIHTAATATLGHAHEIVRAIECPAWMCNATPDFSAFGDKFTELLKKGWAAAWGLMIIIAAFFVLFESIQLRHANKKTDPSERAKAKSHFAGALVGLVGSILVPAIILIVLTFVG